MKLVPLKTEMAARLAPAFQALEQGVADGAYPGAVLAVGHRGALSVRACGKSNRSARAASVQPDTIYDTASLTKPVVTTTLAAMLCEAGQLELAAPVSRYLSSWACGPDAEQRARVTIAHLLTHTSGLPAHEDYFRMAKGHAEIVARAVAQRLVYEPGSRTLYSDIGFILLGEIIENLTGHGLEELSKQRIFEPLGMNHTTFRPAKSLRPRIASTERSSARGRLLQGDVNDENAEAMGGVAGHAGMFSNAPDLAIFCQMLLNGGIYAHERILRRKTVAEFTSANALAANTRTLGWNMPSGPSPSGRYYSSGRHLSKQSFGHTGYTGTSIWIDPVKELFVVLLTNAARVHENPEDDLIRRVQPAVHDAVIECLDLVPSECKA